jgi:hypothetical protein
MKIVRVTLRPKKNDYDHLCEKIIVLPNIENNTELTEHFWGRFILENIDDFIFERFIRLRASYSTFEKKNLLELEPTSIYNFFTEDGCLEFENMDEPDMIVSDMNFIES